MKRCIAYLIFLLLFVKSTDKELITSSENNPLQIVTTDSGPELSPNNFMSSLNLCQPNQNIISDESSQNSLKREKLLKNNVKVTSSADNSIVCPSIKNNSLSENLNENISQVKLCDKENKKYSESNLLPQTSSNNASTSNSVKNNYTLITYKDIKNYSKNWNFKNIQKVHSVDLNINLKFYSKKFNKSITKETFFSRASMVLINQINYHKNYGKVKFTYNILNLIINEFNNDYKNASLLFIFLTFTTKGLKNYVVNHNTYCIEHLLQISLINFIFSDVSIKNTIKIWKKFNFKFYDIKTGYDILVYVGLYFYFVDGNENVNCFVYSYKKFVKESLERIFWENI